MINFEVEIDVEAFEKRDTRVEFDTDAYHQLLEDMAPAGSSDLTIQVSPLHSFGRSIPRRVLTSLTSLDYKTGTYRNNKIEVRCSDDVVKTNNTLRHETKHYIQDALGQIDMRAEYRKIAHQIKNGIAIAAVSGGAAYEVGCEPIAALAVGAAIGRVAFTAVNHLQYINHPLERDAREFADEIANSDVYGNIITFHS